MRRTKMGARAKPLLRLSLVVFLLFLVASWLVFVGIVANRDAEKTSMVTVSNKMSKRLKRNGGERKHGSHFEANHHLVYVSKRRVPNGPDPIHNRRAVITRQPPSA